MSWSKIAAVSTVVFFVFGFVMIDSAVAGEKIKWKVKGSSIKGRVKRKNTSP